VLFFFDTAAVRPLTPGAGGGRVGARPLLEALYFSLTALSAPFFAINLPVFLCSYVFSGRARCPTRPLCTPPGGLGTAPPSPTAPTTAPTTPITTTGTDAAGN